MGLRVASGGVYFIGRCNASEFFVVFAVRIGRVYVTGAVVVDGAGLRLVYCEVRLERVPGGGWIDVRCTLYSCSVGFGASRGRDDPYRKSGLAYCT